MGKVRAESTPGQEQTGQKVAGAASRIVNLLRGDRRHDLSAQAHTILPSDVRFAMQYRGAKLSAGHVEQLHTAGFPRAAYYLAMKAASEQHEAQIEMLRRLAASGFDYDQLGVEDIRVGTAAMDRVPGAEPGTVGGEKLGQFSRHGPTGDVESFDEVLGFELADRPDAALFIVANYPFIALDVMARHSLEKGNPLGIINPDHLAPSEYPLGFVMDNNSTGIEISPFGTDFRLPPGSVIFDDVVREGRTKEQVMSWAGDETSFVTAISLPNL